MGSVLCNYIAFFAVLFIVITFRRTYFHCKSGDSSHCYFLFLSSNLSKLLIDGFSNQTFSYLFKLIVILFFNNLHPSFILLTTIVSTLCQYCDEPYYLLIRLFILHSEEVFHFPTLSNINIFLISSNIHILAFRKHLKTT